MWSKLIQRKLLRLATNSKESFQAAVEWAGCNLPEPIGENDIFHIYGPIRKIEKDDDPRNLFEIAGHVITMGEVTLGYLQNELQLLAVPETGQKKVWSKPLHVFAELPDEDDESIPYTGKCGEVWDLQQIEFDDDSVLQGSLVVDEELFQLAKVVTKPEEQLEILHYFLLDHPYSYSLRRAKDDEKTRIVSQLTLSPEKNRLLRELLDDDNLAWAFLCFLAYYAKIVKDKAHDRLESAVYDFNNEVRAQNLCQEIDCLDLQIFLSLIENDIWLADEYLVRDISKSWNATVPRWHSFLATVADMLFVKSQRTFNDAVSAGKIAVTKEFCWTIPKVRLKSLIKRLKKDNGHDAKKALINILNFGEELLTVKECDSICRTIFEEGVYPIFKELAQSSPNSYLRWFAAENHGFRFIVDARSHTNEE